MMSVETTSAEIIDGRAIAARVRADVAREVEAFAERFGGARPGLATILVGDDPASAVYVSGKQKACREVGMEGFNFPLPADAPREDVVALLERLNADPDVSGILLQLPLPGHLDGIELTGLVDPLKDVDGLTPVSAGLLALGREGLRPCTPLGVMALLEAAGAELEGAEAVVIGRSNLFGKPMAQLLLGANATVTTCHSRTRDLPAVCRRADVLIAAVGRPQMVKADWVKPGATVIDVGMNRMNTSPPTLTGDVDFDAVRQVARAITPVPGGVGPMTVAFLLRNTLQAARMQRERAS
jgi:methylenetetrahydrofolate dehydrogenase (NADP+)/methenyltetrahydrofolate cyclohydrolase